MRGFASRLALAGIDARTFNLSFFRARRADCKRAEQQCSGSCDGGARGFSSIQHVNSPKLIRSRNTGLHSSVQTITSNRLPLGPDMRSRYFEIFFGHSPKSRRGTGSMLAALSEKADSMRNFLLK